MRYRAVRQVEALPMAPRVDAVPSRADALLSRLSRRTTTGRYIADVDGSGSTTSLGVPTWSLEVEMQF
jgi:hypothetical protein